MTNIADFQPGKNTSAALVHAIRTAAEQIHRVHGAHGAAEGQNIVAAGKMVDSGNHLVHHIVIPALMVFDAPTVIGALGSPGFVIDGIDREHRAFTLFDKSCPMVYHMEIFKVHEAAALAGNKQHRLAAVTVDFEFHGAVQPTAVMLMIFDLHLSLSL